MAKTFVARSLALGILGVWACEVPDLPSFAEAPGNDASLPDAGLDDATIEEGPEGGSDVTTTEEGPDAGPDAPTIERGPDAGPDAPTIERGPDAGPDSAADAAGDGDTGSNDASEDAPADAPADASEDASADAPEDAPVDALEDAPADAPPCVADAARCRDNSVQSCGPNGQWSEPTACAPPAPFCLEGACTETPPSCQPGGPGMTNCGLGGSGTESCCTSLEVEGGTFWRTYTNAADGGLATEADPATLSSFRLDKYLITVGRFRQYVNYLVDGGSLPAPGSGKHVHLNGGMGLVDSSSDAGALEMGWDPNQILPGDLPTGADAQNRWDDNLGSCINQVDGGMVPYSTWTSSPSYNETLPINCIAWDEAQAFCIWDGGFLPSEAEWEYAAAGGAQQLLFPWGSSPVGNSNLRAISWCNYPSEDGICTGVASIAPVGTASQGAGAFGQLDLAGDLFESVLDWDAPYVNPCVDCAYLSPTSKGRVMRGGSFGKFAGTLSTIFEAAHRTVVPTPRYRDLGARCARTP
jgi:formylglycine-generating enzyme required for sulfatase activity